MAGQRQPIELVIAKGKKNLTKEEIQARRDSEVKPITSRLQKMMYMLFGLVKHYRTTKHY